MKFLLLTCFIAVAYTLSHATGVELDELTLNDGYDYSLTTSKAIKLFDLLNAKRECWKPGHMCKDCQTRVNCIEISPGHWEENGAHTCAENETCKNTECVEGPNPPCGPGAKMPFICRHIGMFPDQFDCQRLHLCAPGPDATFIEHTIQCGGDYIYNPLTTYCDTKLQVDGTCYPTSRATEWPVPPCEEDGQAGAIIENPSIYYVCEIHPDSKDVLYPVIRLCSNGGSFDEIEMRCVPKP